MFGELWKNGSDQSSAAPKTRDLVLGLAWDYKNLLLLWGADWKFSYESSCSASRGSPSDAEHLSRVTEFSMRTEQPL